ncbi:hypothetical protein OIU76_003239 [Salix suchowensis]|nr:hypothetical protein OIU76_003239 [Salix suchowensis]
MAIVTKKALNFNPLCLFALLSRDLSKVSNTIWRQVASRSRESKANNHILSEDANKRGLQTEFVPTCFNSD